MDIAFLLFLQKIRLALDGVWDTFMLDVSRLGEGLLTFLLMAGIYWCIDKKCGQLMGWNVSLGCLMNQWMKRAFHIDRPWIRDERIQPVEAALDGAGGYSFPSGHTSRAAANWGVLGYFLWKHGKEKSVKLLSGIAWGVVIFVMLSRNYLGVHTPQDVLAAFAMGVILIILLDKVLVWAEAGKNRDILVTGLGCIICFVPMLRYGCLSNAGASFGFMIGWMLERRFVRFRVDTERSVRLLRFAVGAVLLLAIFTVCPAVLGQFMPARYAAFFTNFILAIFMMCIYPFFFSRLEADRPYVWKRRLLFGIGTAIAVVLLGSMAGVYWKHKVTEGQAQNTGAANAELQKELAPVPVIVAHRGYSGVSPENTRPAFENAIDIGADMIELDVQLTGDGQVVVFHDSDLLRITGCEGTVADYSLKELQQMDAGIWFGADFEGEKIPTLAEVLELVQGSDVNIYLELKDIGDAEGFEEAVLDLVREYDMQDRCLMASFRYEYLRHFKELDESIQVLFNTSSGSLTLPEEFPADYYGLYTEMITADLVEAVHNAGSQAYVWTANTPVQMRNAAAMGADGIVTNYPGLARVALQPEYAYLSEHYVTSYNYPGLYDRGLPEAYQTMVVQGLTKVGGQLVISAYDHAGEQNSILYLLGSDGKLQRTIDLGFHAHVGGIAYDGTHDLLWTTGADGQVYALSWSSIQNGTYQGEILCALDAGLVNHSGGKVASFMTIDGLNLYVGSYVDGGNGVLNRYDITDAMNPVLVSQVSIPQRIQGITFMWNEVTQKKEMLLSQSYQMSDSHFLSFTYDDAIMEYAEPNEDIVMPEGMEQIQSSANGLYILFESGARPYRATARLANDQVWVIDRGIENAKAENGKGGREMELFNIICGVCSIAGLMVSLFTAGKVVKISKDYHYDNGNDYSKVINSGKGNTYHGSYAGRDSINGAGSGEQK